MSQMVDGPSHFGVPTTFAPRKMRRIAVLPRWFPNEAKAAVPGGAVAATVPAVVG